MKAVNSCSNSNRCRHHDGFRVSNVITHLLLTHCRLELFWCLCLAGNRSVNLMRTSHLDSSSNLVKTVTCLCHGCQCKGIFRHLYENTVA